MTRNKRFGSKRGEKLGFYWRPGDRFIPLSSEMLTSDAWYHLTPAFQGVLIEVLQKYGKWSRGDTHISRGGFTFTFAEYTGPVSEETFRKAMREICHVGFLSVNLEDQDFGCATARWYMPSTGWRDYKLADQEARRRQLKQAKKKDRLRKKSRRIRDYRNDQAA